MLLELYDTYSLYHRIPSIPTGQYYGKHSTKAEYTIEIVFFGHAARFGLEHNTGSGRCL
jgi:hypothetical protein